MRVFLIILFVILLLIPQFFLSKFKGTQSHYIKILSGVALLVLIWVFGTDAPFGPKILLTTIACTTIWKEYSFLNNQASK
jgi:hypothetical protein